MVVVLLNDYIRMESHLVSWDGRTMMRLIHHVPSFEGFVDQTSGLELSGKRLQEATWLSTPALAFLGLHWSLTLLQLMSCKLQFNHQCVAALAKSKEITS